MSKETIKAAREHVRNTYGSAFARKASGKLSLALAASAWSRNERVPLVHTVIQTKPVDLPFPPLGDVVRQARRSAADGGAWTPDVALDPGLRATARPWLHPSVFMREIYVRAMRERSLLAMGPVRDELESRIAAILDGMPGTAGGDERPATTIEMCWLNQTVRTWSTGPVLAALAEDRRVRHLDLPGALAGELMKSGVTVGAVEHRATTHRTGGNVVVAVIDGEVSLHHPALGGRVVHRQNLTGEPWGVPSPHGTAVAGIIAARGEGQYVGMAPGAVLYNYKVLRTNGGPVTSDFELALALQHALEDGARVANCSVGSDSPPDGRSSLVRACDNAWALGMTVVKSAGNGGPALRKNQGTITCPGDANGVIVVGATLRDGRSVPRYSSRGPVRGKQRCPDLVAPGGMDMDGERIESCTVGGGFGGSSEGTSLAAPHVTGILALILEGNPDLTPDEQRDLLLAHCVDVMAENEFGKGAGMISIANLA